MSSWRVTSGHCGERIICYSFSIHELPNYNKLMFKLNLINSINFNGTVDSHPIQWPLRGPRGKPLDTGILQVISIFATDYIQSIAMATDPHGDHAHTCISTRLFPDVIIRKDLRKSSSCPGNHINQNIVLLSFTLPVICADSYTTAAV